MPFFYYAILNFQLFFKVIFETYIDYVEKRKITIYDHKDNFMQLMTQLFAEAEEQEELDGGNMLHRVIVIQDKLLSLGMTFRQYLLFHCMPDTSMIPVFFRMEICTGASRCLLY